MRLKKSLFNSIAGIILMIVIGIFSFIKISIIIKYLGNEINGLNNVVGQIFNFLMIGEAGLGLATTTLLYEPISKRNSKKINNIIAGSQKAIIIIAILILLASVVTSFFVPLFIKDSTLQSKTISMIFILFAIKALIPQISQPIKAYAMANQDEYYINILKLISVILVNVVEIMLIINTQNYAYVLIGGVVCTAICEVVIIMTLLKKYHFIKIFSKDKDFGAVSHMKELVKVNVVSTVAKSVDPIIISRFIGLIATSFYSNYSYVQNFVQSIIGIFLGSVTHAFGDMFVKKEDGLYEKFNMYVILSNFIASTSAIIFYLCIQNFIPVWIGEEALLSTSIVTLFSILIYMYTVMRPMNTLIVTNGFFNLASKSATYETIVNLVLSILLVRSIGINGVIIASIISFLICSFWYFPFKTYKNMFGKSSYNYFVKQGISIVVLIVTLVSAELIKQAIYFKVETMVRFFTSSIGIAIIVLIVNFIIYYIISNDFRRLVDFILKKIQTFLGKNIS